MYDRAIGKVRQQINSAGSQLHEHTHPQARDINTPKRQPQQPQQPQQPEQQKQQEQVQPKQQQQQQQQQPEVQRQPSFSCSSHSSHSDLQRSSSTSVSSMCQIVPLLSANQRSSITTNQNKDNMTRVLKHLFRLQAGFMIAGIAGLLTMVPVFVTDFSLSLESPSRPTMQDTTTLTDFSCCMLAEHRPPLFSGVLK